jgi:hypothetical protein
LLTATIDRLWNGSAARPDEIAYVRAIRDEVGMQVEVEAPLHHDPPPASPAGRCPGLWNHEVVELFLVGPDDRYLELEFGPHGHYLILQLEGRRRVVTDAIELNYRAEIDGSRWRGTTLLPPTLIPCPALRWNAFAIHGEGGARRYLAAHPVPGDGPDFHRLDLFPSLSGNGHGG